MADINNLNITNIEQFNSDVVRLRNCAESLEIERNKMYIIILNSTTVWTGEDQQMYKRRFDIAQESIKKVIKMMRDYADRLERIGKSYQSTHSTTTNKAGSLKGIVNLKGY